MMAGDLKIITTVCPGCGEESDIAFRATPIRFEGAMLCPACGQMYPVVFVSQSDYDGGDQ
jgi:uncharacterized protein YbaR (Trm112 family)